MSTNTTTARRRPQITPGMLVRVRRPGEKVTRLIEVWHVKKGLIIGQEPHTSTYELGGEHEGEYRGHAVAPIGHVAEIVGEIANDRLVERTAPAPVTCKAPALAA